MTSWYDYWASQRGLGIRMKHAWAEWAYQNHIMTLEQRNQMLD